MLLIFLSVKQNCGIAFIAFHIFLAADSQLTVHIDIDHRLLFILSHQCKSGSGSLKTYRNTLLFIVSSCAVPVVCASFSRSI